MFFRENFHLIVCRWFSKFYMHIFLNTTYHKIRVCTVWKFETNCLLMRYEFLATKLQMDWCPSTVWDLQKMVLMVCIVYRALKKSAPRTLLPSNLFFLLSASNRFATDHLGYQAHAVWLKNQDDFQNIIFHTNCAILLHIELQTKFNLWNCWGLKNGSTFIFSSISDDAVLPF